jgi:Leucine-rich repeat (LRR) protein
MKGSLLTRIGTNTTIFHLVARYLDRNDVIRMCCVSNDFKWVIGIVEQQTRELKLCCVSPNIAKFVNLERLKVHAIFYEIGNLINLCELDLSCSHLYELPDSIGNLTNLKYLNVGYNHLKSIPESFRNLTNLKTFIFEGNAGLIVPSFVNRPNRRVKGRKAIRTVPPPPLPQ